MNGLLAFTKKEFMEQLRSYRAYILLAVLFLFGMSSPLFAKLTPEVLSHMSMQGVTITIPKPTVLDAWAQFFKNISQMGVVVLLLIFAGTLSQEFSKGTLTLPLSKGLSRGAVIGAKFFTAAVTWTAGYALAALTSCGYTQYLFGRYAEPRLFFSLFCLWLFGIFLLAVLLLASTAVPGSYGGLLLTAAVLGILLVAGAFPRLQKWDPVTLASQNSAVLASAKAAGDLTAAVWVTLIASACCLVAALLVFRRKNI